ncbi:uncharacterized protein LOC142321320 [Lycorma delicatula]|uniref:uncharacterized protein LOC142321320 n=1 Tax=Lycorma delicatula TaxID=130591 RepID=UPI003F51760B
MPPLWHPQLWLIIFLINLMLFTNGEKVWINPKPRYLPFPMGIGNKIQIITGFGIPVDVKGQSLSLGLILKTNYELPTNISIFSEAEYLLRKSPSPSRWTLYKTVESALTRLSLGGRECLLRSICQAADVSFGQDGILGEILHILLIPSTSVEDETGGTDYIKAEELGWKDGSKCSNIFPRCSSNLLDMISLIKEEVAEGIF